MIRLEPLPRDGSLPNLDVQTALLTTLTKMPIRTEHLRESKIGRVIMFYSKCDRVVAPLKKIVNELLGRLFCGAIRSEDDQATRARVPQGVRTAFEIVPKSDLSYNKNDKPKASESNHYKKIRNKFQLNKRKQGF
ncbi:Transcription factor iws1 [Phlyctochytrium bullatum]|nr:Transcription factor iws1 [Phlyctochytrium bullatum]